MFPIDPFDVLGSTAGKIVADGLTAAMVGMWNAGLWLLRLCLTIQDAVLTPNVGEAGPAALLYRSTFWIAGSVALILCIAQLGWALARRDGRSLGRALVGIAQFALIWAGWIGYAALVLAACSGLVSALMESLLNVTEWSAWQPWEQFTVRDVSDGTLAFVLGFMGLLLWIAAIGHVFVMLARAGALLVLAAVTPITAAGLVSDFGRGWFWKSFRWFHAAALTPVVMVMTLGVGVQITTGIANGHGNEPIWNSLGTAFVAVVLICISTFSPLALFKLLAFMDPSTTSGTALRTGLAAAGGIQGLLSGLGGTSSAAGSSAAATTDADGRSAGEDSAADTTTSRFSSAAETGLGMLGPVGAAGSAGLAAMGSIGGTGAAMGADLTNQMGVGHGTYPPDFSARGRRATSETNHSPNGSGGTETGPDMPDAPAVQPPTTGTLRTPSSPGAPGSARGTGSTAATEEVAAAAVVL